VGNVGDALREVSCIARYRHVAGAMRDCMLTAVGLNSARRVWTGHGAIYLDEESRPATLGRESEKVNAYFETDES
jgi:hypothetical protein